MIKRSTKVISVTTENYFEIDDIDVNKILVSKRESCCKKKTHLNTLLGMMIMMISDHYI